MIKTELRDIEVDETRLAQQAAGEADAFLALYDRYFARVYTYFRYRIDDPHASDDLTAQAFEQALAHIASFNPQRGPFAAWLFAIARNLANARLREARRYVWLPVDSLANQPAGGPSPEEAAIQSGQEELLLEGIRELPSRQRDLLALKFSARLTNRQIAVLSGLSEANVGVIIHRAIQQLRQKVLVAEEFYE